MTATIGTLAGKQTDPVGPPRVKRNRQSVRPPVKRTPFDTTLLGTKGQFMKKQYIVPPRCRATTFGS